ncbi:MAG TPA: anti-sigma factor [Blastocatellia bacterium]|nr:anti-sigma factor [Blastocatellia bacterium]
MGSPDDDSLGEWMTHDEVQQQLDSYALGVADDVTARRIAAHLSDGCRDCQAEMDAWNATVGALALATAPATPSPAVKDRLLARVQSTPQIKSSPAVAPVTISKPKTDWRGWAVAAVLLIALGGTFFYMRRQIAAQETALGQLQSYIDQQSTRIAADETQLGHQKALVALLDAKDTNITALAPTGAQPTVPAKVLWNPNQKSWTLVANGMPAAPADKSYQLWFIVNGQKISGGVFKSPDEVSSQSIPAGVTSADVIAITLEKAGGSPQPEGPIILAGKAS